MTHHPTTSGISESLAWVICACGYIGTVQTYEAADPKWRMEMAAQKVKDHIAERAPLSTVSEGEEK